MATMRMSAIVLVGNTFLCKKTGRFSSWPVYNMLVKLNDIVCENR